MPNLVRKLQKSAKTASQSAGAIGWITYSEGRGALATLVGSAALAALLSPVAFGQYQYAAAAAGICSAMALTGVQAAVSRAAATGHGGSIRQAFRVSLLSYLPVSIGAAGVAAYYAMRGDPTLSIAFAAISVTNPIANSAAVFSSYLQGKGDFRRHARLGDPTVILPIVAGVVAAYAGANPGIVIAASLGTRAILNLACYLWLASEVPDDATRDPKFLHNAVHGSGQNAIGAAAGRLDSIVVFQMLGSAELAAFSVATAIADRAAAAFRSMTQAIFPRLAAKNSDDVDSSIRRHRHAFWLSGFAGSVGGAIATPIIILLVFPKYAAVAWLASLYSAISLITFAGFVPETALSAQQRHRPLYAARIASAIVGLLAVFGLGRVAGVSGAVVGRALGRVASTATSLWNFRNDGQKPESPRTSEPLPR